MSRYPDAPHELAFDERLWGGLLYLSAPLGPLLALRLPGRQAHPFIRTHTLQALTLGILVASAAALLYLPSLGTSPALLFINWLYAYRAFQGEEFPIPIVTEFLKQQKWL